MGIKVEGKDFDRNSKYGEESFFEVKSYERVSISPIGDVFLINTFNGSIEYKFNIGVEFSNLNYNQVDKQYYLLKVENEVEIFRVSKGGALKSLKKFEELKNIQIEKLISDISIDGILYFMDKKSDKIYAISLGQSKTDFIKKSIQFDECIKLKNEVEFSAFTHNIVDGNIYGVDKKSNKMIRVDISNGDITELTSKGDLEKCDISIMFSDNLGYLYAIDNLEGRVYKVVISLNEATITNLGQRNRDNKEIEIIKKLNHKEKNKINKREYNIDNGIANGRLYKNIRVKNIDVIENTKNGVLNINKTNGVWTYIPNYDFNGLDKFKVLLTKENKQMEEIKIEVNCAELLGDINFTNPKLYIEQVADRSNISFDEFIEYKIFIRNTSNLEAKNIILKEILDQGLSFEKGSLEINGVKQGIKSLNFIELENLAVDEKVEITFKAYLNNIIERCDKLECVASVRAEFKPYDYKEAQVLNFESNIISTDILYGNISCEDIIFIADKSVTTIDDIINLKIKLKNNGNVEIEKLILKNLVAKGTIFEKDEIIIDGEKFNFDMGSYGLILDKLSVNQTITLEYTVKVIEGEHDNLEFKPVLEYEYFVSYEKKVRKLFFNTLNIINVISRIDIQKYFDVENAIIGDKVKCNIILSHIGNINAKNIMIKEILDDGIIYDGNLVINGEKSKLLLTEGIEFPMLVSGQNIHISYEGTIHSCALDDLVKFNTEISYSYMVCSKVFEIKNQRKNSNLKVLKHDLKVEGHFSKEKVAIGDEFDMDIKLTNYGRTKLENIMLFYPLFELVDILSIQINQKDFYSEILVEPQIRDLECGESKKIILKLRATNLIGKDNLKHIEMQADIKTQNNDIVKVNSFTKIENIIEIFNPELAIKKFINKEFVVVDEEVEMSVILENKGDLVLENIILTDLLSDELEFIEGSVVINNKENEDESIISGVCIQRLRINECIKVKCKFKAIKVSNIGTDIITKAFVVYNYNLGEDAFCRSIESNSCVLNISKVELEIQKKSNKDFVKLGDEILFDITIINTGTRDVLNALFIDELFDGLEVINRSFSIDDEFVNNVNVQKGIIIGDIKVASIKKIRYKAKMVKINSNIDLNTKTYVRYSYILSDGGNGRGISEFKENNLDSIDIALSNFRQVDKGEYLKIPYEKPEIEELDGISACVEILSTHIVKTSVVSSIEGQILTGYKLLINGCINENVEYTSSEDFSVMYSTNYQIPFSDYIILPLDFNINNKVEVEGKIENVYYKKINKREFFNNATILLVAKILST